MSKSKRVIKLKAKVRKLQTDLIAHQDTNKVLDGSLNSVRTRLKITGVDIATNIRVIAIRDAKIRVMEEHRAHSQKEFQRLMRDYERALALLNSLTTNMKIKQG